MFPLTPKTVEKRFYNQGSYLMIMLLILLNSDVEQQGFWFKWLPLPQTSYQKILQIILRPYFLISLQNFIAFLKSQRH